MAENQLYCAGCNVRFKAKKYDPKRTYNCPKCAQPLAVQGEADTSTDGVALNTQGGISAEKSNDPLIGRKVGQYKILKKLGQGGMGSVYQAKHLELGRAVALKLLSPKLAEEEPDAVERFKREARAAAVLSHPNVVTVYYVGTEGPHHFIELEYVDGESLQTRVQREKRLTVAEATRITMDAARALGAAHEQNIVHRDIKPGNIMLTRDEQVKVMDFGLAKDVASSSQLTMSGHIMGTPHYMSPEQCDGEKLDGRSDIYSLGATYYAMLAGRTPYQGSSLLSILRQQADAPVPDVREQCPDLPKRVQRIIEKSMAKKPDDRYGTCQDMVADLETVLADAGAPGGRAASAKPGQAHDLKASLSKAMGPLRGKPAIAIASVLCLAIALVVGHTMMPRDASETEPVTDEVAENEAADEPATAERPAPTAESKLPPGFEKAFEIPTVDKDQHGNPVVTRTGGRSDPQTGWPYEIWLKEPRMELVLVPAGEFMMGTPDAEIEQARKAPETAHARGEEGPQHRVQISKPFYLGKYEALVTAAQFRQIVDATICSIDAGAWLNPGPQPTDRAPTVCVKWIEVAAFCQELSKRCGVTVTLPTEAQWEYACRAGAQVQSQPEDDLDGTRLGEYAWNEKNSGKDPCPVGQKKPNKLGLYDMIGNVWEWCADWYDGRYYEGSPQTDPPGPSAGQLRVMRGGSWRNPSHTQRVAYRGKQAPTARDSNIGFRCVVIPSSSP